MTPQSVPIRVQLPWLLEMTTDELSLPLRKCSGASSDWKCCRIDAHNPGDLDVFEFTNRFHFGAWQLVWLLDKAGNHKDRNPSSHSVLICLSEIANIQIYKSWLSREACHKLQTGQLPASSYRYLISRLYTSVPHGRLFQLLPYYDSTCSAVSLYPFVRRNLMNQGLMVEIMHTLSTPTVTSYSMFTPAARKRAVDERDDFIVPYKTWRKSQNCKHFRFCFICYPERSRRSYGWRHSSFNLKM